MSTPELTEIQPTTMRAVTQPAYGSSEVLDLETIPTPTVADDEVLVEVVAAGIDRGVWHLMHGHPYLIRVMGFGLTRPKQPVPGLDLAGRVVAVGDAVTGFAVGDEVFGIGQGSFAEFAVAKATKLAHKPSSITFEQAAACAISGITALQALTAAGRLQAGDHVLVVGASGGVGSFTVQLAKALGATVTGVASGPKLDEVRRIGADHVIDYTAEPIDARVGQYDLIVDIGGRNPVRRLRRALTPTGTLVIVGGEGGNRVTGGFIERQVFAALLSPFVRQRIPFFVNKESGESIEELAGYLAAGPVTPVIGGRYALDAVPAAIEALEAGAITGKAVITVSAPR